MPGTRKTIGKRASAGGGLTATQAAMRIIEREIPRAAELLGSAASIAPSSWDTVALPLGSRQTLVGALRNRPNWYRVARKDIDALARLVVQRNWFARPVHRMRVSLFGYGFRFRDEEAREWTGQGAYPFRSIQSDMIEEWNISRCIVAWWRRDADSGTLPRIHVPNACDVEHEFIGGIERITLTFQRHSKLSDAEAAVLGTRIAEAVKSGKKLIIPKGDPEFDFAVMKEGKSTDPVPVSPYVNLFDDLDFIEAVRVGDWNGAKARWEIIRHTQKGYGVSSGDRAGDKRTHAKREELKAILAAMKKILGKEDLVTNFDQKVEWLTFPKEHFHKDILAEVRTRLVHFGGPFAFILLGGTSQISDAVAPLLDQFRAEVLAFREEFADFLTGIFRSESFRSGYGSAMPDLVPAWGVQPLYSPEAFVRYLNALATNAIAAPQTLRALFGFDDRIEGDLMEQSHENPKRHTPPFEPRQGISAFFTTPGDSGGNQNRQTIPQEPGRPPASDL